MSDALLTFRGYDEPVPGAGWQRLFDQTWPSYRAWYLQDGERARPGLDECAAMLGRHMPELMPTWYRLSALAGGDDLAARMLSLWRPPPYLAGCSQVVTAVGAPVLLRNYDYDPALTERVVHGSAFAGRGVAGMSDCLWGLLDGMNADGLVASLGYGGRRAVGPGFGIPLVLRYVLEVCATVDEARAVLARLPVHMVYTVLLVDRSGRHLTAFLGPDREPAFVQHAAVTNHQEIPGPLDGPAAVRSVDRQQQLLALLAGGADEAGLLAQLLTPPLYMPGVLNGFGTVYTAVYRPADLTFSYHWPGSDWRHAVDAITTGPHRVDLAHPGCGPVAAT